MKRVQVIPHPHEHENTVKTGDLMKKHIIVYHGKKKKEIEITGDTTPYDILKHFDQNPDNVLIVRNNAPIPMDEKLNSGDTIRLIQVTSGG